MANPRNVFRNLKIKILEIASAISVSTAVMLAVFIFLSAQVTQAATNAGITYQGRILKPDGTTLQGASVQFRLQLRTPNTSSCLMYEETQLQDMRNSNGIFSLTMNDGTGTRSDSTALGLDRIFANRGSFTFDPATCQSGSSYTPNEDDGRTLVVYFKDETMSVWEPMPPQALNFVPLAIEAKQIAGFGAKNLLRFAESDGTLVNTSPLNNAQYLELVALVSGNSNVYEKAGKLAGGTLPTLAAGQVLGWSGTAWTAVDPSSSSASVLKDPDGGANTVTFQVDPAIAANYTVTWPATVGAANQVLVNDGTGKLSWGAPPAATQWTTTGSDIYYSTGNVGIGATSPTKALEVVSASTEVARFKSTTADSYLSLNGSGSVLGDQGLGVNAGDLYLKTSNTQRFRINAAGATQIYGSLTAGAASQSTLSVGSGLMFTVGTNNVERLRINSTGNVGIGTTSPITALDVAGAIRVGDTTATCASTNAGAIRYNTGAVQYCNGTAWVAMDSDSFAAVSCTNGQAIFRGPSGWICKTGSSVTAADTVVMRDASQNFAANTATLNTLSLNNAGSVVNINNPLGAAYNLTLPANAGTNGYVLTTNGSGVLSWTDLGTSGQWSVSGSDVYRSSGRVGIGTSAPTSKLNVADNPYFETGNYDTSFIRSVANSNTVSNGHIITQRVNMLVGDSRQTHLTSASHNDLQLLSSGTTVRGMTQSNFASVNASGAVQNVTSNSNEIAIASGSTVTDAMGIYSKIANSGATTNGYGVYIDTIGGTNHWGLYQVGATEKNYFAGQVGIGTSTPGAYLDINPPEIVNPSATVTGLSSTMITNNTSAGTQTVYGAWMQASANQNSSPNGSLTGSISLVQNGAIGTTTDVVAADNQAFHIWNGTTTNMIGTRSEATSAWTGASVTNLTGVYGHAYRLQGTATNMHGGNFLADQTNGSTVANAYGVKSEVKSYSTSTITNGYGVYAAVTPNSGTITNRYGVYIADAGTGTNYYNLYSAGTGKNYFSGSVGIGTSAPSNSLTVRANGASTRSIAVTNSSNLAVATLGTTGGNNGKFESFNAAGSTVFAKIAGDEFSYVSNSGFGVNVTAPLAMLDTKGSTSDDTKAAFNARNSADVSLMYVRNDGNVGIGSAAPTTKLQVAGIISPAIDNTHDLGTSALRFKDIYAANNVIQTSDARLKTDVKDSDLGLKFVNSLRPVSYYWKEGDSKLHYGVIAQETEKALGEAKKQSGRSQEVDNVIVTHDEKTDRYGVRYTELIAPIIKAVQELYNGFINHDSRLTGLEKQNNSVQRSIASVAAQQESTNAKTVKLELENQKLKLENAAQAKQLEALKSWVCAKDPAAAICK